MTRIAQPSDLKTVVGRLRAMLGHLTRRDRETVAEACEALMELAGRLHAVKTTGVDPGDVEASPLLQPRMPHRGSVTEQLEQAATDPRRVRAVADETAPFTREQFDYVESRLSQRRTGVLTDIVDPRELRIASGLRRNLKDVAAYYAESSDGSAAYGMLHQLVEANVDAVLGPLPKGGDVEITPGTRLDA